MSLFSKKVACSVKSMIPVVLDMLSATASSIFDNAFIMLHISNVVGHCWTATCRCVQERGIFWLCILILAEEIDIYDDIYLMELVQS